MLFSFTRTSGLAFSKSAISVVMLGSHDQTVMTVRVSGCPQEATTSVIAQIVSNAEIRRRSRRNRADIVMSSP